MQPTKGLTPLQVRLKRITFYTDAGLSKPMAHLYAETLEFDIDQDGTGSWQFYANWKDYVEEVTGQAVTTEAGIAEATEILVQLIGPVDPDEYAAITLETLKPEPEPVPAIQKTTRVRKTGGKPVEEIKQSAESRPLEVSAVGIRTELSAQLDYLIETHGFSAVLSAIETILNSTAATFHKIGIRKVSACLNCSASAVSDSAAMLAFMDADGSSQEPIKSTTSTATV